jgi:hypothetical protein
MDAASEQIDDIELSTHVYCVAGMLEGIVRDLRASMEVLEKVGEAHGRAGWCEGGISALERLERDIGISVGVRVETEEESARCRDAAKEEVQS